jgi:hypothetical protein
MAGSVTHTVKAVVKRPGTDKPQYVTVGRATTDDQGRISVYLDTLPRDMANWTGWLNLFPVEPGRPTRAVPDVSDEDDIPF